MRAKPTIACTMGDPSGIGPEILLKAIAARDFSDLARIIVVGDARVAKDVIDLCDLGLRVVTVAHPDEASSGDGTVAVLDLDNVKTIDYGTVSAPAGAAAVQYIEKAAELANAGVVSAIVTGPISKQAAWAAGARVPGHTEMLEDLFGVERGGSMTAFMLDKLRIFFLTRHCSLLDAIAWLQVDRIVSALRAIDGHMRRLGMATPRIALAALNPHAGEDGKMGREEIEILKPAIEAAQAEGIQAVGPVPADAAFFQCRNGVYDCVASLHHDQGHIAAKTLDFFGTVACQLGLPVVRTSVDHGTAFDIAGKGRADAAGQEAAMRVAVELTQIFRK